MPKAPPTKKTDASFRQTRIQNILAVVKRIPKGKVASYGQVAELAGYPNQARLVGWILKGLPLATAIPWQRVVNHRGYIPSRGRIGETLEQMRRLRGEGVRVTDLGEIPIIFYRWVP